MPAADFGGLMSPLQIKAMKLPSRFVMPGMQRARCVDGRLLPEMADYYRRRVDGGVGLVIGEGCAIDHPSSIWESRFPRLSDQTLDGWSACVDAVHAAGGRMLIQLSHPGAFRSEKQALPGAPGPALSASGLYGADKINGRAATLEELVDIRESFAAAARYVEAIGADGVELHGCHGFFLDGFLWPRTNQRSDGYGGDIRNRARFPAEVVSAIREAVGSDFVISYRFSQWKEVDYHAKIVETPAELELLLSVLRSAGVDIFHPSTRRFNAPEWPGSDLGLAGWTKQLTDAPVIAVGSVGLTNDVMESLLDGKEPEFAGQAMLSELVRRFENKEFDLIAVGRSLLSDPNWVEKISQGRFEEIRPFRKRDMGEALEMEPTLIIDAHKDDVEEKVS
jgi:2,4-dienoyl-CoA reductase-like NADH-dependent reductase (Old Yellow Enzyme family)